MLVFPPNKALMDAQLEMLAVEGVGAAVVGVGTGGKVGAGVGTVTEGVGGVGAIPAKAN